MDKREKILLIATPLLLFTAACSSDDTIQTSAQPTAHMQEAQPDSEIHNPFIVKAEPILNDQGPSLTVDQIKKLEIIVEDSHGETKLEYEMKDHGSSMLKFKNSYMDINVSGAIAKGQLHEWMEKWDIYNVLNNILLEHTAKVDVNTVSPLKKLQLETFDGKKIEWDKGKVKVQFKEKN